MDHPHARRLPLPHRLLPQEVGRITGFPIIGVRDQLLLGVGSLGAGSSSLERARSLECESSPVHSTCLLAWRLFAQQHPAGGLSTAKRNETNEILAQPTRFRCRPGPLALPLRRQHTATNLVNVYGISRAHSSSVASQRRSTSAGSATEGAQWFAAPKTSDSGHRRQGGESVHHGKTPIGTGAWRGSSP